MNLGSPVSWSATPPPTSSVDQGSGRRRDGRLVVAAIAVAILPIAVAALHAVIDGWQPLSDNGITAVRSLDVFSRYFPFLGNASSVSLSLHSGVNHPGPLQFLLLAPVVALAGPAAGLAVGTATINAASLGVAGWAAWRRAGTLGGLAAALVGAALSWSMGSALLIDPFAPHALMLPLFACCVVAWAVADGDLALLPVAIVCASFAVQTHLSAVYLGGGLLVVAAAWGWWRSGRAGWRWILVSVVVGVVLWIPPLVQEVTTERGNLTLLVEAAQDPPSGTIGSRDATRLTAAVVGAPPFWLRDSLRTSLRPAGGTLLSAATSVDHLPVPSVPVAVVEIAIAVGLLALVGVAARRRRDRAVVTLAIVAGGALVLAWYSVAHVTTRSFGVSSHTFRILWPVSAFVTFALMLGATRMLRGRAARSAVSVLAVGVLVLAAMNLPASASSGGAQVDEWAIPVVRSIDRQLGSLHADAPVLADWPGIAFGEPYSAAFTAELRRRDIAFVVRDRGLVRQYSSARRYNGHNARTQIFYRLGQAARAAQLGAFTRVAFHDGLARDERAAYRRLARSVGDALRRGEIRAKSTLAGAQHLGLYRDLAFPFTTAAAADRAVASRQLTGAWRQHFVRAPAPVAARLEALARLQERIDRATVGVFVGPVHATVP